MVHASGKQAGAQNSEHLVMEFGGCRRQAMQEVDTSLKFKMKCYIVGLSLPVHPSIQ